MPTHLRIPTGGTGRTEAIEKLALGLFRRIGPGACLLLAAQLDELCGEGEPEPPQPPAQGREPTDAPTRGPGRDRRPTPAPARPLP